MKITKNITAILAIFAVGFLITLGSCKKDDDTDSGNSGTAVSKAGLLTSGGWITKSAEQYMGAPYDTTINVYDLMDDCDKDDIMTFKSDNTISSDAGATKCDPNDPQTEDAGTWSFASNDTKLVITEDGDVTEFDITSLTSSELAIELTEYDSSAMATITMRMAFKH